MNKKDLDIQIKKQLTNQKHIEIYDKIFETLSFMLEEYSRDLSRADVDYLDVPKNTIAVLDFIIASIIKVQKGQRIALGLDESEFEESAPQINIIEGLSENKI